MRPIKILHNDEGSILLYSISPEYLDRIARSHHYLADEASQCYSRLPSSPFTATVSTYLARVVYSDEELSDWNDTSQDRCFLFQSNGTIHSHCETTSDSDLDDFVICCVDSYPSSAFTTLQFEIGEFEVPDWEPLETIQENQDQLALLERDLVEYVRASHAETKPRDSVAREIREIFEKRGL